MEAFFKYATPVTYWILIVVWLYIFIFYLKKIKSKENEDKLLRLLLIILGIDAFRALFESLYFGAWFTSFSEIIPIEIYDFLTQPQNVFFPKFINLIASVLILVLILKKWLPSEIKQKKELENLVKSQSDELVKQNQQLQKLAKVVDQSPVSIVITDLDGNIEYVNDYFEKITGYTSEEVIGANPRILKSGKQDKKLYKNLWQTISNGRVWRGELQNKAKDGTIYWESVSISPVINESGDIFSYVAVKENITELVKSNLELAEINKKLIDAQEIGSIGNWTYDVVSGRIQWSDQLFEIYDRDIVQGSPSLEGFRSYHVETEESFRRLLEALEQGKAYDEVITLITKQKQKKYLRTVGVPKYNDEKKLVQFSGVAQDVTTPRTFELQLIESESRLKNITDNIEGLVQRYVQYEDGSNEVIYISKGVEELHGLTQKQVMEDSSVLWAQIAEEDMDRVVKSIQKSAKNLSLWDCKWRIKTPGGSVKWLHGKGTPRKETIGGSIIWDTMIIDITKEVNFEESLKKTNVQLQAAQDIARIGYWSFDVADGEVYLSPIVREIHEMDKNVNVNEGVVYYKEGYDRERIDFVLKEAIEKGIPYKEELRIITEKGNERWVRTNGMPIMKDGKCVQVSGTFVDITQEKEREQKILDNLNEKETLISEIHHRVKNNLALVSAFLQLESMQTDSKEINDLVDRNVARLTSIAKIHEILYSDSDFSNIDFSKHLGFIIQHASLLAGSNGHSINFSQDLSEVKLNVNQAMPLGLLVNELLLNSIKHAFTGISKPEINIQLKASDDTIEVLVKDNGVGLAEDVTSGLGTTLIETLSSQLSARLTRKNNDGLEVSIKITKKDGKGSTSSM